MLKIKSVPCPRCHKTTEVEITEEQYELLTDLNGPFVQDIFPDWSADQRELLISGYHSECWDADFKSLDVDDWEH